MQFLSPSLSYAYTQTSANENRNGATKIEECYSLLVMKTCTKVSVCSKYYRTYTNPPPLPQLLSVVRKNSSISTCTIVVSHLKGTAIVYKPHVLRRCLSSQGTSMYPRVHEGCWATVASSQNCETISGYYKSYYGTSHLYHGLFFVRKLSMTSTCNSHISVQHTQAPTPVFP